MIVAIDGPSGTGKTTVAQAVAKRLGLRYVDTGAMYRAFTYLCLLRHVSLDQPDAVQHLLEQFHFHVEEQDGEKRYWVNEEEVTRAIRSQQVTHWVSAVAALAPVREKIVSIQREMEEKGKIVLEGRDIGTVVFPQAEAKIFLTATPEERAHRRYRELKEKHPEQAVSWKQVLEDQQRRDHQDSNRSLSPLRPAKDAYLLDTSDLSVEEVVDAIVAYVQTRSV